MPCMPRVGLFTAVVAVAVSATVLRGQQATSDMTTLRCSRMGSGVCTTVGGHDHRSLALAPRPVAPPTDALVLLGPGNDLSSWQATDGSPASWPMSGGV